MKTVIIILIFLSTLYAAAPKEVLLLHSYNKGLKWSDGISKGVESVFLKHPQYEVTTEYMDTKKIDTDAYFDTLLTLYKKKFAKRNYKVVIVADNYALKFAIENHKSLFKEVPIVFCGIENFNKRDLPLALQNFVTGVIEYKEIDKNLNLIKKMVPNINTLYIISDNSFSSQAIKGQILNSAKKYKDDFKIIYDNEIKLSTLHFKLNALPVPSAILFTSLYKDVDGDYIPYQKLRHLFNTSKHPVFALNRIHLGEGVLGGVMLNPHAQGSQAASKAIAILKGKTPLQVELSTPVSHTYFDDTILEKFKFTKSNIPIGSTIINKQKDFFEKNREVIDSLFLIMPLLVILIIFLIINISKRISLEVKLIEQNKLDKVLLNNIKSAIFWKSKDDILLGCNDSLSYILDMPKDKIIGQHIRDIMPEVCQKVHSYNNFIDEFETRLYYTAKNPIDVLIRRKNYLNKKNEEAGVVTVISDITDIKKLETQRKKDEQFVIQRSKLSEIGEMITSIAHQWKTPLVEISAIAQELQYKRKKTQISQKDTDDFVYDIMTQVSYMTNTIDDFRNFIKPSAFKSEFSVNQAIKELLNVIEHNIKYNYIQIDIEYDNNQEYFIFGYPNEFKQSILNVINNARDSVIKRRDSENIKGKISLHVKGKDDTVSIRIKDNGIGIEPKNLNRIFEPFVTTKKDGDGFGLYMVRLIIEDKMGGNIKALKCDDGAEILIRIKNKLNKIK